MSRTSTYLNFPRNTEEAFNFYKSVFGGEFVGGINRMGGAPAGSGQPPLAEADKNLVMHVVLPILGGHMLMGTDAPESMGFKVNMGNNMYINLEPDTKEEAEKSFPWLREYWETFGGFFARPPGGESLADVRAKMASVASQATGPGESSAASAPEPPAASTPPPPPDEEQPAGDDSPTT